MVSYAWGSDEQQARVKALVDQLIGDGIDVVFDRYHLRDGDDTDQFMEQVAVRGDVRKVIAICDPLYVRKMNNRQGGSGKEGMIMSQHVYEQLRNSGADKTQRERRFIAVIFDRDPDLAESDPGHLPTMFGPMKYIDMSTSERYDQNYDQLLRFLLDKPEFVAPPLGKVPSHLLGDAPTPAAGHAQAQRIRRLVDQDKSADGAWRDYLEQVEGVIRAMPPAAKGEQGQASLDFQVVLEEVERFTLVRDGFVAILLHSVRQGEVPTAQLTEFFERLMRVSDQLREAHQKGSWILSAACFYHTEFVLMELVLYMAAVFANENQVESLTEFTEHTFFFQRYQETKSASFAELQHIPEQDMIERAYRQVSGQNWHSPIGAWLIDRATLREVPVETLAQADVLLFLKSSLGGTSQSQGRMWRSRWLCQVGPYWERTRSLPIIQRWVSRKRLQPWLPFFGVQSADELRHLLNAAFPNNSFHKYFRDPWESVSLESWLKISEWGTLN